MHRLTKSIFTGVMALGLLTPMAQSTFHPNQITVSAKRYRHRRRTRRVTRRRSSALSYAQAKKAVRKAYNGKDRYRDRFRLQNQSRRGRYTTVRATFGAQAKIDFQYSSRGPQRSDPCHD